MAHAQKSYFVFLRNGRVHLNRRGRQFSRQLAAELCASAVVMLDIPCSEVVLRVLATHFIRQIPLPCVTVCHHISPGFYLCPENGGSALLRNIGSCLYQTAWRRGWYRQSMWAFEQRQVFHPVLGPSAVGVVPPIPHIRSHATNVI
jgi:hypothetical protein